MADIHNLDEQLAEYFSFTVLGHQYRFRHMTTEEMQRLRELEKDEKQSNDFLFTFITPESQDSPQFAEIQKKMILPQWIRFRKMIQSEFGG